MEEPVVKNAKPMWIYLAVVVLLAAFSGCGGGLDDDTVLEVDGEPITVDEFKTMAIQRFGGEQMARSKSDDELRDYLDDVLEAELKAIDGRDKGYSNRPGVVKAYEEARMMAAIGELYNREIVDSLIPEDSLKAFYERDANEVNASHILIRIDDDTDSVQAHDRVAEIRREILGDDGGIDSAGFAEAARKYSEDQSAPDGELGYFRRGVMVPGFENVAFSLEPGDVSEPVYTPFGWHLLMAHAFRPIEDRAPFEEDRQRIKQLAMRERSQELISAARQYVKDLEAERNVEFHTDNIEKVYRQMKPRTPHADPFSLLTEDQLELVLASYDADTDLTAGDLRDYVRKHMARREFEGADMVKAIVENYLTEKVLLPAAAEQNGYMSDPDVLDQAKMAADMKIRQLVNERLNRIPDASDGDLRAYYDEHAQDYLLDAQYTLVEVLVKKRALADSIRAMAERGEKSLRELAIEHSVRANAQENKGVLGPIRKAQYGAIGRNAAKAEIGEIVGPLRVRDKWSVFKLISREEPRPDTFENVRKKVSVDWRTWKREQQQQAYVDSLKQAVEYRVNYDALKRVFPEAAEDEAES